MCIQFSKSVKGKDFCLGKYTLHLFELGEGKCTPKFQKNQKNFLDFENSPITQKKPPVSLRKQAAHQSDYNLDVLNLNFFLLSFQKFAENIINCVCVSALLNKTILQGYKRIDNPVVLAFIKINMKCRLSHLICPPYFEIAFFSIQKTSLE